MLEGGASPKRISTLLPHAGPQSRGSLRPQDSSILQLVSFKLSAIKEVWWKVHETPFPQKKISWNKLGHHPQKMRNRKSFRYHSMLVLGYIPGVYPGSLLISTEVR